MFGTSEPEAIRYSPAPPASATPALRAGRRAEALALAAVLSLLGASRGQAQTSGDTPDRTKALLKLNLEDLMAMKVETVYGASKYAQLIRHAPASVTIVTSEEIRRYGCRTLADILASVPGIYLSNDRNDTYLGVRGIGRSGGYNDRVLVLVDGHRLNDNVYDQALVGYGFPVDVDLIDRVEVIRGPGSSIYGSNALLAVINVITRRDHPTKGVETAGELGSFGTGFGRLTYGSESKRGLRLMLSTSFDDSNGPSRLYFQAFDNPATNYGIAQHADYSSFEQVFGNLSFGDFSFEGVYGSREQGVPTASFGTVFNDPRNRTTDSRGYLDLRYHHEFRNRWEVAGNLAYDQADYSGGYVYDYSPPQPTTLNIDYSHGKWWSADVQATRAFLVRHKVTFGSEFRRNYEQVQGNYDASPYFRYLLDRRNSNVFGLYAQDEFSLSKSLILDAGVRYDYYSTFGGSTNPRLALIYSPLDQTTVKLLYGTAFRAPNDYELYYSAFPNIGNPALRPETIQSFEIAVDQGLGRRLSISADVFEERGHDLIVDRQNADGSIQYWNAYSVLARGMEVEFDGKWPSGVETRLSYTFEPARDLQTGKWLVDSPRQMAKFKLTVPLARKKAFAGADVSYFSSRQTLAGSTAPGFVLPDLTLISAPVGKRFNLSASLYNLFDTRIGYPGGEENREDIIYQDGRTFRVKLSYTFGSGSGRR